MKPIIYQLIPRIFANFNENCVPDGTLEQNGSGKLSSITMPVLRSIAGMGFSHVWLTGVIEHSHCSDYRAYGIPLDNPHVIKGKAGSPYAIKDYYDIDPDLAVDPLRRMKEFEKTVDRIHQAGLRLIIDFVPNHVARVYSSDARPEGAPDDFGADDYSTMFFAPTNNFYYIPGHPFSPTVDMGTGNDAYHEFPAKASGNDCFTASPGVYDWYDTVKLNYGVDPANGWRHFNPIPSTWRKMLHILLYWSAKGVDGFRCDMAHMVPLEFWQWAIPQVRDAHPGIIFIAEIYDINLYRPFIEIGGFDYLYDKVGLYDTLRDIVTSGRPAADITRAWQNVDGHQHNMLYFLENHDEQRFASSQFAGDPFKAIAPMAVSALLGPGAVMVYAGQELGEPAADAEGYSGLDGRTTIYDYWSLDTLRRWLDNGNPSDKKLTERQRWLREKYAEILKMCNKEQAIAKGRFFDLMYVNYDNPTINPHRQYVFMRNLAEETIIIAVNFSADSCDMAVNLPRHAFEMLQIPQGTAPMTELLSKRKSTKHIADGHPFEIFLEPWGAAVWKVNHKNIKPIDEKIDKASSVATEK